MSKEMVQTLEFLFFCCNKYIQIFKRINDDLNKRRLYKNEDNQNKKGKERKHNEATYLFIFLQIRDF